MISPWHPAVLSFFVRHVIVWWLLYNIIINTVIHYGKTNTGLLCSPWVEACMIPVDGLLQGLNHATEVSPSCESKDRFPDTSYTKDEIRNTTHIYFMVVDELFDLLTRTWGQKSVG